MELMRRTHADDLAEALATDRADWIKPLDAPLTQAQELFMKGYREAQKDLIAALVRSGRIADYRKA